MYVLISLKIDIGSTCDDSNGDATQFLNQMKSKRRRAPALIQDDSITSGMIIKKGLVTWYNTVFR